ncbi:glycogenin glucosyltransferase [Orbilia brochopaga]|uniref:glycogenin glucosyltransferase n=1 Tax=Orbilia brochopaga TaxID=3140254 RepID=A0AAV9TXX1_9PEZI
MEGEEVYCTMLLTDGYLPGAQVLAHSLRDGGATRKLAVIVTADSLSAATMTELHRLYDYVIPVERITNRAHGNLALMGRMDLSSAFTKINLWRQTQFSKIVYIDADAVALRAPEELFAVNERLAACPDIGWPDCFNSGVLVLKPDLGTFYGLQNLATRGVSFDGADQGLLNEYFQRWHRLSFTYNVTPSGHYQYVPAYRHYRANITVAHFIGASKPWIVGRGASDDSSAYGELLGRWWGTWDAHYRPLSEQDPAGGWQHTRRGGHPTDYDPDFRREHGAWDSRPQQQRTWRPPSPKRHDHHHHVQEQHHHHEHHHPPSPVFLPKEHVPYVPREMPYTAYSQTQHHQEHHQEHHHHVHAPQPMHQHQHWHDGRRYSQEIPHRLENGLPLPPFEPPLQPWDAGRFSPPPHSKPEASNWPVQAYANTWGTDQQDTALFVPPRLASPPQNLHFNPPPKVVKPAKPTPIFPWEQRTVPKPTRVFAGDETARSPSPEPPLEEEELVDEVDDEFETDEAYNDPDGDTATGILGFENYNRSNAWDSIPAIEEYVATFTKGRSGASRKGDITPNPTLRSLLPPEISVTPTPFKAMRRGYRSSAMDDESKFPSAKGIPDQQHWDPFKQLEELKNAPSELLSKRSPPSPQSSTSGRGRGSPRSPGSVLVSSSMPVPEKEWHITAFQRRHERGASSSTSSGDLPVVTGDGTVGDLWRPQARRYQSSSTQTEAIETSDAETQSDEEEIDAVAAGMI